MRRLFVFGSLPPLEFGSKPDITSWQLRELFEDNLSQSALKQIHILQFWIDLANIQAVLYKTDAFDTRSVFSKELLSSFMKESEGLPAYVYDFFSEFTTDEERRRNFASLIAAYFREERKKAKGFVRKFLDFEHAVRVLITGFRAKRLGRDVVRELQFEDPIDPYVETVLMQKNSSGSFVFPLEFAELETKLEDAGRDPTLQYEALMQFRFDYYSEHIHSHPLEISSLAANMMRLWILEDYFALKVDEGEVILTRAVERGA